MVMSRILYINESLVKLFSGRISKQRLKEELMYTKEKWTSERYFNFSYVKYLPKDYDENQKYPLVFFLHGAGERGDDLDIGSRLGFMKHVREDGAEYPFIFVAPQCPHDKYWGCYTESLLAFLDHICDTRPVRGFLWAEPELGCWRWRSLNASLLLRRYAEVAFIGMARLSKMFLLWYITVIAMKPYPYKIAWR